MAKEKENFLYQEAPPSIKQSAILRDSNDPNENENLNLDLLTQGPSFLKSIFVRLRIRFRIVKLITLLITCWLLYMALKRITDHNQKLSETNAAKNLNGIIKIVNTSPSQPSWNYDAKEVCMVEQPSMSLSDIQVAKLGWKSFLKSVQPKIDSSIANRKEGDPKSRGIVYTGHSGVLKQFVLSVKMLRKFKCNLPIEFWHFDEITEKEAILISSMGSVTVRNMKSIHDSSLKLKKEDGRMWEMKGASILHSSFDQVLFLDTDNVPAKDPTFLFDSQPFRETGAIFWKDFGKLSNANAIWSILEIPCTTEFEQESGQVLIDKSRPDTLKAMYLAAYMQQERKLYFELFWGDKETFRLAWRAVKAPYHMIRPHLAAVGIKKPSIDKFCGHTMVQFGPMWIPSIYGKAPPSWNEPSKPEIVFMHANLFKYEHLEENGKFFPRLIRYRHPEARKNSGGAFDSKSGLCTFLEDYIEDDGLTNQVIQEQLTDHLPAFEADFRQLEIEAKDYLDKN